ncbi:hypothetical protein BaRGS_00030400 [Batillaria attramentaria]|uniref:Uncharacterized protein n=1 Tax=Batillaria attramentaria TaxID=370345 RepID=A0ABD0JUC1_9CAEN
MLCDMCPAWMHPAERKTGAALERRTDQKRTSIRSCHGLCPGLWLAAPRRERRTPAVGASDRPVGLMVMCFASSLAA